MQEEKKRMQVNQDMTDKTQNQEKVQMTIITQKKIQKQIKVVKLVDENKDFETQTQQDLNHNGNMIDKQN